MGDIQFNGTPEEWDALVKKNKKKETLEEAFDRIFDSIDYTEFDFTSFEQGAKWQQERMYSEEEVLAIIFQKRMPYMTDTEIIEWFEQFKKK